MGGAPGSTKVRQRSLMGWPSTRTSALRRPPACQALCAAASISRDCPSCESKRRTSNRSMGRRSAALHRHATQPQAPLHSSRYATIVLRNRKRWSHFRILLHLRNHHGQRGLTSIHLVQPMLNLTRMLGLWTNHAVCWICCLCWTGGMRGCARTCRRYRRRGCPGGGSPAGPWPWPGPGT